MKGLQFTIERLTIYDLEKVISVELCIMGYKRKVGHFCLWW